MDSAATACKIGPGNRWPPEIVSSVSQFKRRAPDDDLLASKLSERFWYRIDHRSVGNYRDALRLDAEIDEKRAELPCLPSGEMER